MLGGAAPDACAAACAAEPSAACALLARHAWLVRGTWRSRLRTLLAQPLLAAAIRHAARRPHSPDGGLALQLLGLLGEDADLPLLRAATRDSADAVAVALAYGWPPATDEVTLALCRLEEQRPDLLRALAPHLERATVTTWLAEADLARLPLALFLAGRLGLEAPATRILAGCDHPRAQVRRAACLAVVAEAHRPCLPRLRDLLRHDPEPQVRIAALRALARLPDPTNLPVLTEALASGPWLVQAQAVPAILAQGEAGRRQLATAQHGPWRSGAIRWIREHAVETAS